MSTKFWSEYHSEDPDVGGKVLWG